MRSLVSLLILATLLTGCTGTGLEGTWVLASRDLPDGSVQRPPDIRGCLTYADGHRNFNVYWKDGQGGEVSLSSIALYDLTETHYRETNIYYSVVLPGAAPQYDLSRQTAASPVHRVDGRMEFKFPMHDEPYAVFEGDRFTASREGEFVDHWRRIE